jgi:CHASE2 domain-containing sensor protein
MKVNWKIVSILIGIWFGALVFIVTLHLRPLRMLLPIIGIVLFLYLVYSTLFFLFKKPSPPASPVVSSDSEKDTEKKES